MLKFIRDNFSWVKDVGIVFFLVLVVFANSNYVTNTKFESYVKSNHEIQLQVNNSLNLIDKTLALMQQNQIILVENEKQIRVNTTNIAEHDSQFRQLNALHLDQYIQNDLIKNAETEFRLKALEKVLKSLEDILKKTTPKFG